MYQFLISNYSIVFMVNILISAVAILIVTILVLFGIIYFVGSLIDDIGSPVNASTRVGLEYEGYKVDYQQTISTENNTDGNELIEEHIEFTKNLNKKILLLLDIFTIIAVLIASRILLGVIKMILVIFGKIK